MQVNNEHEEVMVLYLYRKEAGLFMMFFNVFLSLLVQQFKGKYSIEALKMTFIFMHLKSILGRFVDTLHGCIIPRWGDLRVLGLWSDDT